MIEIGTLLLECCSFLWRTEHRIGSLEEDHIDCGSPGIDQSLVCPIGIDIVSFCPNAAPDRSEEHTSELQSRPHLVCRLLLEKKKTNFNQCGTRTCIVSCSTPNLLEIP